MSAGAAVAVWRRPLTHARRDTRRSSCTRSRRCSRRVIRVDAARCRVARITVQPLPSPARCGAARARATGAGVARRAGCRRRTARRCSAPVAGLYCHPARVGVTRCLVSVRRSRCRVARRTQCCCVVGVEGGASDAAAGAGIARRAGASVVARRVLFVYTQPVAGLHESSVHALLSPHEAVVSVLMQPDAGSHVSAVHALLSSQSMAEPPTNEPPEQASPVV